MTDNPPPENDKKLLDRLQPYEEPGINAVKDPNELLNFII